MHKSSSTLNFKKDMKDKESENCFEKSSDSIKDMLNKSNLGKENRLIKTKILNKKENPKKKHASLQNKKSFNITFLPNIKKKKML